MSVRQLYILMLGPFAAFCLVLSRLLRLPEMASIEREVANDRSPRPPPSDPVEVEAALADGLDELGMRAHVIEPGRDARELVPTRVSVGAQVIGALNAAGRPMAAEEIADAIGAPSHHTITPRLAELEQAGLVVRTEERHTNRSGKTAARFRLAIEEAASAQDRS